MKNRNIISRAVAGVMVMVISLSIMPKVYLHELFADHDDAPSCTDSYIKGPCIHKQGFKCQQAEIVVPASYIAHHEYDSADKKEFITIPASRITSSLLQLFLSPDSGRGPPAHV